MIKAKMEIFQREDFIKAKFDRNYRLKIEVIQT